MTNEGISPKPCKQCKRMFFPPSYAISASNWAKRKYCSHACAYESRIGEVRSEEWGRNISKAKKGVPNPKHSAVMTGRTLSPEHREAISRGAKRKGSQRREKNPGWKGDDIGYKGLHDRNRRVFVPPADNCCTKCNCLPGGRYQLHDWAFLHHPDPHSENQEDYVYLCRSCHRKMDGNWR